MGHSTHRRLSYPWRSCVSAEPRCVSLSEVQYTAARLFGKSFEHRRHAIKNLGGLGAGPHLSYGIEKFKLFDLSIAKKHHRYPDLPLRGMQYSGSKAK